MTRQPIPDAFERKHNRGYDEVTRFRVRMLPRHAPLDCMECAAYAGVGIQRVRWAHTSGALRSVQVNGDGPIIRRMSLVSWVIAWWAQGAPKKPLASGPTPTDRLQAILASADDLVSMLVDDPADPVGLGLGLVAVRSDVDEGG